MWYWTGPTQPRSSDLGSSTGQIFSWKKKLDGREAAAPQKHDAVENIFLDLACIFRAREMALQVKMTGEVGIQKKEKEATTDCPSWQAVRKFSPHPWPYNDFLSFVHCDPTRRSQNNHRSHRIISRSLQFSIWASMDLGWFHGGKGLVGV